MKKIEIEIAEFSNPNTPPEPPTVKIPWAYAGNVDKMFVVRKNDQSTGRVYSLNEFTLKDFVLSLSDADVITICSDDIKYIGPRNWEPKEIPTASIPLNYFNYYMDLDGIVLTPNESAKGGGNWSSIMSLIFNNVSQNRLKAIWTSYSINVDSGDTRPIGLSLVQEEYVPKIEYIDINSRATNFSAKVKWGYAVKDLPMTVSTNDGKIITNGTKCFRDYKEQFLSLLSVHNEHRYFPCFIELLPNDNLSLVAICKEPLANNVCCYIGLISVTDWGIEFNIWGPGGIPASLENIFHRHDLIVSFVWSKPSSLDGDSTPVGFQITTPNIRASKISYVENLSVDAGEQVSTKNQCDNNVECDPLTLTWKCSNCGGSYELVESFPPPARTEHEYKCKVCGHIKYTFRRQL